MFKQKKSHAKNYETELSSNSAFNFGPSALIEENSEQEPDYDEIHADDDDVDLDETTVEYPGDDRYFDQHEPLVKDSGTESGEEAISWNTVKKKNKKNAEGSPAERLRKRGQKSVKFWEDYEGHKQNKDEEDRYGKTDKKVKKNSHKKFARLTGSSDWDFSHVHFGEKSKKRRKFRLRIPYTHKDDAIIALVCIIALTILAVCMYFVFYYPRYANMQVARAYGSLGYKEAQYQAGLRYLHKHKDTIQNKTRAVEWFKLAHDQGHKKASFMLAHSHVSHEEVRKHTGLAGDREKILKMFKEAARHGIPEARHMYIKCKNGDHFCE